MSQKIELIELWMLSYPFEKPVQFSWFAGKNWSEREILFLKLQDSDGNIGYSGKLSLGQETRILSEWLQEYILGRELDIDELELRNLLTNWAARGYNFFWVELAIWDLWAKREGRPLSHLLREKADLHTEIDERVEVYASLPLNLPLKERLNSLEKLAERELRALSLPLSGNFSADLQLIRETRHLLGDSWMLILEANRAAPLWTFSTENKKNWKLSHALDFCDSVEKYRIEWIEDPLSLYDYGDLSVLRSESPIPVAGGHLNAGWHEYKILIDQGSLDIYRPDPTFSGGLSTSLQLLDACLRRDLHFYPHAGYTTFSLAAALQLYAALPRKFIFQFPFEPELWEPKHRDFFLQNPLELNRDGTLSVPSSPGLGIQIDPGAVKKYGELLLAHRL